MSKTPPLGELFVGCTSPRGRCCTARQARMVEARFEACYLSSSGTASNPLGVPDAGLTSLAKMALNARYVASPIRIPLLGDAHAGRGGRAEAIQRARASCRQAGVAAVYLSGPRSRAEMAAFVCGVRAVAPAVPIMGDALAVQPPRWEESAALGYAVASYLAAAIEPANVAAWDCLHACRRRGVAALVECQARTCDYPLARFGAKRYSASAGCAS